MENVNKIQIRIDTISSSASTVIIPFGLDFFPIDNTELQKTEFVDKEVEKAINPIIDSEKYPFYPVISSSTISAIHSIDYNIVDLIGSPITIDYLGLTDDDIRYRREPFVRTYLRLSFFDTDDSKTQYLLARETIHLHLEDTWFVNNTLDFQYNIPLIFKANNEQLFGGNKGEGFRYYWKKYNLPNTVYIKISIMNAKTGKVINLFNDFIPNPNITKVQIIQGKKDYIKCNFFENKSIINQLFYHLTSGISFINGLNPIENKIVLNLKPIP
jgi:hypothetical protein